MKNLETVRCWLHSRSQPRYPFKLCPDCRAEAPHEAIVVEAVVNYFSGTKFQEFIIETENSIQMGTALRRADIVLLDDEGHFIAIAECKQTGVVNYGHKQLQSYLCATDTPFGIFANSTDPDAWEFYENLGRNQFKEITLGQFNVGIGVARPIELVTKRESSLKSDCTSRSRFARRRERAKRSNRQNV